MVIPASFVYPIAAAIATGLLSITLLKIKPGILSASLSDFTGVTIGKSCLFVGILAALFFGVSAVENSTIGQLRWSAVLYVVLLAAWIDLERRIIPNGIILLGLFAWIVFSFFSGSPTLGLYLGVTLLIAFILINMISTRVFKKKGFGGGDLKLCIIIVLLCGMDGLWAIGLSILMGGVYGGVAIMTRVIDRKDYLPFAPFLLAGTVTGYFWVSWHVASVMLYGF